MQQEIQKNGISTAILGLFDDDGNVVKGIDSKEIKGRTDENGDVILTKMPAGTYKYKQITARLGYIIDENEYTVEIKENGEVIFGEENEGVIYNDRVKTDITVSKVWADSDDVFGKRPESITLKVLKGSEEVERAEVNESNSWSHTFSLPKYDENSRIISYTVDEEMDEEVQKFIKNL